MEAVQGYTRKSLVSGLQKKITKGTKVTEFDQNTSSKTSNKSAVDKGVRTVATLNNLRGAKYCRRHGISSSRTSRFIWIIIRKY